MLLKVVKSTISIKKDGKLSTILYIWYIKHKRFPSGQIMKHNAQICARIVMQQWIVNDC